MMNMNNTKVKIKEICRIVSGTTPKTDKEEFWNGNISWITPAEIKDNSFYIYSTERTISQEGKDKNSLFLMPKGTVLLSSRAPIGKVAIAGIDMCCNQGFKNLICGDRVNNEFLYYFLKSKTDFLNSLGRGATFKELSKSIVENISISLPTLQEQFFIKEKLKKIDFLIELKCIVLRKLNELINSRFNEIINLEKIEKNIKLGELGVFISGGTPSKFHAEYFDGGDIPFVTTPSLGKNYIDENDAQYFITELGLKESSTKLVDRDSILIGTRVGVGKSSINKRPLCINQDILAITNIKDGFIPLFLKLVIDRNTSKLNNLKRGATIQGITSKDIKNIDVPVISFSIQNELVKFIKQIDKSKF